MSSTFYGLNIGYSGLTAYHAALTTTGNNIANAETKGFSRQNTVQTAANALRTYTTYGMTGSGVDVTGIEQTRSKYYDEKYRYTTSSLGEYKTKADYAAQIENYFNDDGDMIHGFATLYDDLFASLENLQDNPGDTATRTAFVGQCVALSEYFNSVSDELTSLQTDVNDQIKIAADAMNSIAQQIATLNKEINIIELKGDKANELRDQRNLLVDELSQYTDVKIIEDPIYAAGRDEYGNLPDPTGAYRYQVIISGNQTLVDGYDYRTLYCEAHAVDNKINQSDATGLYDLRWDDTGMRYYPVGNAYSGKLNGLLQMRDGNNNEYFHGEIIEKADAPEKTVTVQVKDEYLSDITKLTIDGKGTIVLGSTEYRFRGWTANYKMDGADIVKDDFGNPVIESYTFDLNTDANAEAQLEKVADLTGKSARIGINVDYQGIPYYMEQLNEWVRRFAQIFNKIEESGEDSSGNALAAATRNGVAVNENEKPTAFFVGVNPLDSDSPYVFSDMCEANMVDGTGNVMRDADGRIITSSIINISSSSDSYYLLTAANFSVNRNIMADASRMSTASSQADIDLEKNDILKELEEIRYNKKYMEFRGCSSEEFLSCVLGDVALNASSANTFTNNFTNIQNVIENQRLSVSGVDDDEEALNLVKFKNAYNLSAKMIQVMQEIYDKLINGTAV